MNILGNYKIVIKALFAIILLSCNNNKIILNSKYRNVEANPKFLYLLIHYDKSKIFELQYLNSKDNYKDFIKNQSKEDSILHFMVNLKIRRIEIQLPNSISFYPSEIDDNHVFLNYSLKRPNYWDTFVCEERINLDSNWTIFRLYKESI
jgi:hypothetical protein